MDHRSGSASQGTSPLKAAGFLVGLLVVVAMAFALGMKAGRELDVLRPERGGETVKLADAKPEMRSGAEGSAASRRDDASPKRAETVERGTAAGEPAAEVRPEAAPKPAHTDERAAGSGFGAPVGDEPAPGAAAPTSAPSSSAAKVAATQPAKPDYTIFKTAPGAAAGTKSTPAGSSLEGTASTGTAPKTTAAKPVEAAKPMKDAAAEKEAKVAAAKPATPPPPKAAAASGTGQLKITPDSRTAADKSSPGFVVQVAALQSKGDADQLATRLRAHGAAPYVNKVELPNGTWYRVRVGRFKTLAEAKAAQKKLAATGFRGAEVMSAR